jgi:ATP-dependent DNA ligase
VGFDEGRDEKLCVAQTELVAQIEFTEWTPDGHLRHSKFIGVREDKDPRKVVRELGSGPVIQNPNDHPS